MGKPEVAAGEKYTKSCGDKRIVTDGGDDVVVLAVVSLAAATALLARVNAAATTRDVSDRPFRAL